MSMVVELIVLIATLLGLAVGACSIYWACVKPCARRAAWGRWLCVATLVCLGGTALFAAMTHAEGLSLLGLVSGLLMVGMLWEIPAVAVSERLTGPPRKQDSLSFSANLLLRRHLAKL